MPGRALQPDERRFYELLETLPLAVYSAEPTPPYAPLYVSRGVEMLGYAREEWLNTPDRWIQQIHPEDRERVLAASERAFSRREPLDEVYRMVTRDGDVRWIHDRGSFVYDEDGEAVEWRGILMDVTARKEAELQLAEGKARYLTLIDALNNAVAMQEATLEATRDGILVVDNYGHMVRMNRKFIELWRLPDKVVAARDDAAAIASVLDQLEDPDAFLQKIHELNASPDLESFDILRFKDGRVVERESKPQRLRGETVGRVWSFRDVTQRLELEAQVRQSHKMDAIGALAGGVAHDFNNILTVIRGNIELMLADTRLPEEHRADLSEVYGAAERAMELTRQLLAFSRKQVIHPVALDLAEVVREMEPMLRRLIGEDIAVETQLESKTTVVADRAQIEQVLLNLVVNARDAMPRGGMVRIETAHVELTTERRLRSGAVVPAGSHVALEIQDSGQGIKPEVIDRVFEPFFTTKEAGKGTGLGLATVYGIVKQSNGFIDVDNRPEGGAAFRVLLPSAGNARPALRSAEFPVVVVGAGTVLVVEDEGAVRHFVRRALEKRGYRILEAGSGQEAIDVVRSHSDGIDLIITDIVMPGMNGARLIQELRHMNVDAPVLYMTGYTDDEMVRRGVIQSEMQLLPKPFTTPQLAAAVQKALRLQNVD